MPPLLARFLCLVVCLPRGRQFVVVGAACAEQFGRVLIDAGAGGDQLKGEVAVVLLEDAVVSGVPD